MIAFASSFPGQIVARQIAPGQELIVQKSGFLASEEGVDLSIFLSKEIRSRIFWWRRVYHAETFRKWNSISRI